MPLIRLLSRCFSCLSTGRHHRAFTRKDASVTDHDVRKQPSAASASLNKLVGTATTDIQQILHSVNDGASSLYSSSLNRCWCQGRRDVRRCWIVGQLGAECFGNVGVLWRVTALGVNAGYGMALGLWSRRGCRGKTGDAAQ